MRRFFWAVAVLAMLGVAPAAAQEAGSVEIGTAEARAIARQALREGKPAIAGALSQALLRQNPEDAEAWMIQALLLRSSGRLDAAREASANAFRYAGSAGLRFDAALLTADILTRQERFTSAQIWLRRADQAAPDEGRRTVVAQAYRVLRQRNPLQVALRFSLKPSNNVNNGAETTEIEIGDLPFRLDETGQQLGGWEASTGLSLGYRLSESQTQRTDLLGEVYFRKVWLSSEARAKAPTARNSDFDYGVIVAGLRHQRLIWPELGPSSITGVLGHNWYGGDALARWGEVQFGQTVKQGERAAIRFGLLARVEKRLDDEINDSVSVGARVEYLRRLEGGGAYSLGAIARNINSDSATVDSRVLGLTAARSFGRTGPVEPKISLTAESRDYRKWTVTPGGREDQSLSLRVDMVWPDVSYYGFVPQATFTARRTWSDVDIYDRNELSLGLTVVSRF